MQQGAGGPQGPDGRLGWGIEGGVRLRLGAHLRAEHGEGKIGGPGGPQEGGRGNVGGG